MGNLVFQATLGGQVNLVGPNTGSTFNLNVPAVSSTLATLTGTETFTNKTLTSPTINSPTLTSAVLGTPASGTLTNCTGLPTSGLTGTISEANGGTGTTTGYYGFKNRIINSAMVIDQRNAGASVTPTVNATYTLDRWVGYLSQSSKYSIQQSTTVPTGFKNSFLVTSLSAYSITSTDNFGIAQNIEGLNTYDLAWGTASAATVTLSFWVRSSLTGTFGGALRNSAGDRAYPFSYTISSANTWEYKTITIAGDTTGTWLTTNGQGIGVVFGLGNGSTLSGTAGAWAAGNLFNATGATSVVGTSGATFYITGVQLEKGSTATSFDYRPYGTELALCQRYYYRTPTFTSGFYSVAGSVGGQVIATVSFPVTMRATPTGSIVTAFTLTNCSSPAIANTTTARTDVTVSVASATNIQAATGVVDATSEL